MDICDLKNTGTERNYGCTAMYICILFFLFLPGYAHQNDHVFNTEGETVCFQQGGIGKAAAADRPGKIKGLADLAQADLLSHTYREAYNYDKRICDFVRQCGDCFSPDIRGGDISPAASGAATTGEGERWLGKTPDREKDRESNLWQEKVLKIKSVRLNGDFDEAECQALELLSCLRAPEYRKLKVKVFQELIEIYLSSGERDKAIGCAETALRYSTDPESKKELYAFLSEAYKEKGFYEKAIACKDSFIEARDSLNEIKNRTFHENNRMRLELLKNEKELSVSQERLKIIRIVFVLSGVICVILIWAFVNKAARNKQRKKIVELQLEREKNDKLLLENKLKKQEMLALLEQERLKHTREKLERDIEIKNKELTSRALFLANRNRMIGDLLNSLSDSRSLPADSGLKADLERLKKQLEENDDWNNFIVHFEQTNQHFIATLRGKHPDLTSNEVRFISLIYINLNTKEISSLLNITPEYCKKKKQQISRKLGLSSAALLYNYLFDLQKDAFCCENGLPENPVYRQVT